MHNVPLADIVRPSGRKAGADVDVPVYAVTKHAGFVPSLEYFKKQVFSREVQGYKLVEPGEFAYATIHLDEGSIGIAPERALISPMYTVFRAEPSCVDPSYLVRFLKSPRALAEYAQLGKGAIHRRKAISLNALGSLPVPLPPIEEQRRIAAILDHADALRAKRRQAPVHLDNLTQSIFHDMFGDPRTWSDLWPMGTIGDIAASTSYGTSTKAGTSGSHAVLRMGNLTVEGRLDLSDLKYMDLDSSNSQKFSVRRGDILFNRTNSTELVGKTAVVRTDVPFAYAGYLIRVRVLGGFEPEFVAGYLNSRHGKATLRAMSKSIVGQANINAKELQTIKIALPPTGLQHSYAHRVAAIEVQRSSCMTQVGTEDELFTSLQSRAFRGEL